MKFALFEKLIFSYIISPCLVQFFIKIFYNMAMTQPSILTEVTIMLDDYLKTNPGVKDLPQPGIVPQPPSP